jgi:hypothetical protein
MTDTDLSDANIDFICAPLTQNAAMVRHLKRMGLVVRTKPNGRPLVNRAHYDAVTSGKTVTNDDEAEPNWGGRRAYA